MPEMPGRPDFWTIGYPMWGVVVYTLIIIAPVAVAAAFYLRYRIWRLGKPMPDLGPWMPRIQGAARLFIKDIVGHRRFIKRELYPGPMRFPE